MSEKFEVEVTIEDALSRSPCLVCVRENCAIRDKIVGMSHCKNVKLNEETRSKLHAMNALREKLYLTYSLATGSRKVELDDADFRSWVKQNYQVRGKP